MNIWQILGLEPTGDLAAIKAAYAVQAKRYHPEDHPEEFRTLHDAYRQAVRYAKRHPLAATTPSKPSVPAPLPPSFKPSYHVHGPTDNPRRAPQHRSADDEFSAEQFQEMRRENKRFHRPVQHKPPVPPALPRGKLPIRGAGAVREPSGGLQFDLLDRPEEPSEAASEEPPDEMDVLPSPKASAPPASAHRNILHWFWAVGFLSLFWVIYLLMFSPIVPPVITAVLYGALCIRLFGIVRQNWPLTLWAAILDVLSMASLDMAISKFYTIAIPENAFALLAVTLPVLRCGFRIYTQVFQKAGKGSCQ